MYETSLIPNLYYNYNFLLFTSLNLSPFNLKDTENRNSDMRLLPILN